MRYLRVYLYDANGVLIGEGLLDENDICPKSENWILPSNATRKQPPSAIENKVIVFDGTNWNYEDIIASEIEVRAEIKRRLLDSDFAMLSDAPFSGTERLEIIAYRKELRDLSELPNFPNVTYPIIPSCLI